MTFLPSCLIVLALHFPQDGSRSSDSPVLPVPQSVEQALEQSPTALQAQIEGRPSAQLSAQLEARVDLIETQQARFLDDLRSAAPFGGPEAAALASDRDILMEQARVIAGLLRRAGVDVSGPTGRLEAIESAELDRSAEVVLDDPHVAEELPLEVLRAHLRPLAKHEVLAHLKRWIEFLRRKSLAVSNAEVAALTTTGGDASEYFARSVLLQQERQNLITRVNVVIDAYGAKGGDVSEHRDYVSSVVDRPAITGFTAFVATMRTWLLSADGGRALLLNLARAAGAVIVAWILGAILSGLVARGMRRLRNASELLREFVVVAVRRTTIFFGLLVALSLMGANMGPLLAAIGAAGLVIGLALQGTLSNFASGILIMINRPFDVGDKIKTSGIFGTVRGLTLITTRIETFDNQIIYVPNNMVWNDTITNVAANPTRRVDLVFGISYGDDMQKARDLLMEVVSAHPKVLADPAPNIRVNELADSSVNLIVRPWAKTEDYWDVYWDLMQAVKERFDREGVSIPFPQRDVHHHYEDGAPRP